MGDKWAGIAVKGDGLHLVVLDLGDKIGVVEDTDWPLQSGDRYEGYAAMYAQLSHYLEAHKMSGVAIRATAVAPRTTMTMAPLECAELRGVVIAAAVKSGTPVHILKGASISKTYGDRNLDGYVSDKEFWKARLSGSLCKPGKEAAMLVLSAAGRK